MLMLLPVNEKMLSCLSMRRRRTQTQGKDVVGLEKESMLVNKEEIWLIVEEKSLLMEK